MPTAFDVANFFLSQKRPDWNWSITHLKLQKLVYYAQAWSLALRDSELFSDDFEAWAHGPVLPNLYSRYRQFYYREIPTIDRTNIDLDDDTLELLTAVWTLYGNKTARDLEQRTHNEEPWKKARRGVQDGARSKRIISKDDMKDFYRQLSDNR